MLTTPELIPINFSYKQRKTNLARKSMIDRYIFYFKNFKINSFCNKEDLAMPHVW
jgi:hypothetical protein